MDRRSLRPTVNVGVGSVRRGRRLATLAVLLSIVTGCSGTTPGATGSTSPGTGSPVPGPTGGPPSLAPPDLSARPLTWFAPLPPMPGRTGSADFMDQFVATAPWAAAASHVDVYKLYGEWVAYHATDAQLQAAVRGIAERGLAVAVEVGPLDHPADCGEGVESFAGVDEGRLIAERIRAAGGRIDVLALDEPYFFAHVYSGAGACHWDVARIATAVVTYRTAMRGLFPDLVVGDTEPTPAPVVTDGVAAWLDAYRAAGGEPFAFLHLDIDWSRAGWPALAQAIAAAARARDVPIGMIYNGGGATERAAWIGQAGERVKAFEAAGVPPDHVLFQSWMVQPDRVLPESDPTTFSGLVRRYFEDHAGLGFPTTGAGANLALRRPVKASATFAGTSAAAAVDGDLDTLWNSGGGPVQWIEVTLEKASAIGEIRLTVAQSPAGPTEHLVYGRRSDGSLVLLHRFTATTEDGTLLAFSPRSPWTGIRAIRIETRISPSWVAWKEIEIFGPR
jgi:hypothetical protein